MAPAIAHFTIGFVAVLAVVSIVRITRYRLTAAYLGGIWGILPDARFFLSGPLATRAEALHDSPTADLFFVHYTLDSPVFRANEIGVTFVSLAILGGAFLLYDWRFGARSPATSVFGTTDEEIDADRNRNQDRR
ncbi:MAG: hypothetical protein ACQETB_09100 [Halobacteriota archaeon]